MNWVKESREELPEDEEDSPNVAELDELQTYIGTRSHKVWVWTAINHYQSGILAIQIGDRSGQTFQRLWERIKKWDSRRYLTDGYCVYANYINPEKHTVLPKTQLTRVEGENTRVQALFSSITSRYFMLFKMSENVMVFNTIIDALPKI